MHERIRKQAKMPVALVLYTLVAWAIMDVQTEPPNAARAQDGQRLAQSACCGVTAALPKQQEFFVAFDAGVNGHAFKDAPARRDGQAPAAPLVLMLGAVAARRRDEDLVRGDVVDIRWTCAEEAEDAKWVPIAIEGRWDGHPQGPFTLSTAVFKQMIWNYHAMRRDLVVDYEHASSVRGQEAPAAGWLKDLRLGQTEAGQAALEGLIAWTPRARGLIKAEEYRYLSPGFALRATDKKTGKNAGARLGHVALTNTPFIDDLPPLSLREGPHDKETEIMDEHLKAIAEKLGLAEDATPEQMTAKADELVQLAEQGKAQTTTLKEVYRRLDLSETATRDQAIAKVVALRNPAGMVPAERLQAVERQLAEQKVDGLVERAQREGRLTAVKEQVDWFRSYALTDPAGAEAYLMHAPKVVPMGGGQRPVPASGGGKEPLTEEDVHLCKELGLSEEEFRKYNDAEYTG